MFVESLPDFMIGFVGGVAFAGIFIAFSIALVVNFGKDSDPRALSRERFVSLPEIAPKRDSDGPATTVSSGVWYQPPERSSASSQPGPRVP